MKIIQSYWTKPMLKGTNWSDFDYHLTTWALSCLRLKKYYSEVSLYTDNLGKEILFDILKLPYSSVFLDLNDIQSVNSAIWAWGKLHTYSLQEDPFIHVDGDVIISEKLPFDSEGLVAQHIEKGFEHNKKFLSILVKEGYVFPKQIVYKGDVAEVNAGILGGNDITFFKEYTCTAKKFLIENGDRINKINITQCAAFNTILEQYFFYSLAKKAYKRIHVLFPEGYIHDDYIQLVNFRNRDRIGYIHPVGYLKTNAFYGEKISEIFYNEYPSEFNLFQKRKRDIYELYGIKDRILTGVQKKHLQFLNSHFNGKEIVEKIRRYCLSSRLNEYKNEDMIMVNPYIKIWQEETGSWKMLVPSILSLPNDIKLITINLGVLGKFMYNLSLQYKNNTFSACDIINSLGDLSDCNKVKIFVALQQLLNMHALVRIEAETEKPAMSKYNPLNYSEKWKI